jgi:hypothetical protein
VRAGCELVFESFARWRKQVRQNPAFASIHFNGRFPVNDTIPAPGDDPQPTEETPAAQDGGMSWGTGNGGAQTTHERGAETIPPSAAASTGISPDDVSSASPTPSTLGRPLTSASGSGAEKNYNASAIYENTRIG